MIGDAGHASPMVTALHGRRDDHAKAGPTADLRFPLPGVRSDDEASRQRAAHPSDAGCRHAIAGATAGEILDQTDHTSPAMVRRDSRNARLARPNMVTKVGP